ncbi:MAG: hypothetical protein LBU91_01315 [Bacteroidales bacterium]|jgi:hypothetical protein|nr:hypothetical protein [Bacteroidales bacterium]
MTVRFRYIVLLLGLAWSFGGFAQKPWNGALPKIRSSSDFSVWTAVNYNLSQFVYSTGTESNSIDYMSNSRLLQTIALDYASYTLQYTFRLPFNTLDNNSPLSDYDRFSTGYGAENWEIDAYVGRVKGWFDVSDSNETDNGEPINLKEDSRYRSDIQMYTAGLTAFYFLSEKYRYSHAMKFAYLQNKSGFTFYSSLKHKYQWVSGDSAFYPTGMRLIENPMNGLQRLFIFESSITFGFTGLWTNKNWFLRGLIGFGPGIQIQNYNKNGKSRTRPFIAPASDLKLSFGYKTNGFYTSINFPVDLMFVFLPDESNYFQHNTFFSFSVGFQMHDLMKAANKRNLRDGAETF